MKNMLDSPRRLRICMTKDDCIICKKQVGNRRSQSAYLKPMEETPANRILQKVGQTSHTNRNKYVNNGSPCRNPVLEFDFILFSFLFLKK